MGRPLRSNNVDPSSQPMSSLSTHKSSPSSNYPPTFHTSSQSQAVSFSVTNPSESLHNSIALEDDETIAPELRLIEKLLRHLDKEIGATAEECEEAGIGITELDEAYKRLHVLKSVFEERKAIFDGTSLNVEEATRQLRSISEKEICHVRWPLLEDYVNFRQNIWVRLFS